jgi:hypothetical protein
MLRSGQDPARPLDRVRRRTASLLMVVLAAALTAGACDPSTPSKGPGCIKVVDEKTGEKRKACLPVAPESKRVDLGKPTFSNPTVVTNPLHPTSRIVQTIYGGQVDGKPFRTEVTLLPDIRTIEWNGKQVKTITSQYLAYLDGRIQEYALDWYAQADNGSVWYFGEDVSDYENGVVVSTEGTWLAGRDGPAAMIMPAHPKVGNVYRVENIPGVVFEEVTVTAANRSLAGPNGPVKGALVVSQLHMDATHADKTFAPGYGEFSTGRGNDLEAVSLAVPTDVLSGPVPAQLATLSAAVREAVDAARRNDWARATGASNTLKGAWDAYRAVGVPPMLDKQMTRDINALAAAVAAREPGKAHDAALRVAQNDLDLRLRHQSVAKTELARLDLWARQLLVDAADRQAGAVAGDVVTLQLIWDRLRHTADPATAGPVDAQLRTLRGAADKRDPDGAARGVPALLVALAAIRTS